MDITIIEISEELQNTENIISDFFYNNWPGIITGIITGLLVSILIYTIQWIRKSSSNWKFKKYKGSYDCYKKEDRSPEKVVMKMVVTVKRNNLFVEGTRLKDNSKTYGIIEMSLSIPEYGKGYYRHTDLDGWGFYEIQIKSMN